MFSNDLEVCIGKYAQTLCVGRDSDLTGDAGGAPVSQVPAKKTYYWCIFGQGGGRQGCSCTG